MAPELSAFNMPDDFDPCPTKESDVYAFGIVMLEVTQSPFFLFQTGQLTPLSQLLTGQEPYWYKRAKTCIHAEAASNGLRPDRTRYTALPDNQWELLEQCWVGEPEKRPSMENISLRLAAWLEPDQV